MNRQALLLSLLALLLIGALWWVFLYSPGQADLATLEDDIAAAEAETVTLTTRVGQLERIRATAPETEALIAQLASIVPTDPALAGAIRQIEAAAQDAGVRVEGLSTSRPSGADDIAPGLHRISISMAVEGSYFQLVDFLRRLEDPTVTARGVVFDALSLSATEYPTLAGSLTGAMYAVLEPVPDADVEVPEEVAPEDGDGDGDGDGDDEGDGAQPLDDEGGVE